MTAEVAYVYDVLQCLDAQGDDTELAAHTHLRALLAQVRADDQHAFEMLVAEMVRPLELYARRFIGSADAAQDVVQDVFARLWEHRQTLHVRGSVRAYFYSAVRNRALNVRRHDAAESARWTAASVGDDVAGMGKGTERADLVLVREEVAARVAGALANLPPRAREAALLRWQNGLSRAEIAAVMGVALGTVKNHLTAATITLRAVLADLRDPK